MKRRRIKNADVQFVTLCPRGANRMSVVYKSDGHAEFDALHKFDVERGELLAVVYSPEMRDELQGTLELLGGGNESE